MGKRALEQAYAQAKVLENTDFVKTEQSADDKDWPELIPLAGELEPSTEFPISSLPGGLATIIKTAANVVQVPLAIAANSFLSATDLIVQGHADVLLEGRRFPTGGYRVSIADSGDRKDTIDDTALAPVREHNMRLSQKYNEELLKYQNASLAYEDARKDALRRAKNFEEKKKALNEIGNPPIAPIDPERIIKDFTIEGLTKVLAEGQPSIGVYAPEGGQILGGHGFTNDYILRTVSGLNQLFDGKAVSRVRSKDGKVTLFNKRVCLHIMIQPFLAPLLVSNRLLSGQGFLWRLLLAWPESLAGLRLIPEDDSKLRETLANSKIIKNYNLRAKNLLALPLPLKQGTRNELAPHCISPDNKSFRLWRAFYNDTERKQRKGEILYPIKGMASRIAEHAIRQASSLALEDNLECSVLSTDFMCGGIEVVNFHLNETLRLCGVGNVRPEIQQAIELYQWLIARRKDKITLAEIYTCGPPSLRDAAIAREVVSLLVSRHYMRPLNERLEFGGKLLKETFELRPEGI